MPKKRRKIYNLDIEEVLEKDYWLAIHTSLEPYLLAFIINQNSQIILSRSNKDIYDEKKQGMFQLFEWSDPINDVVCNLLSNKYISEKKQIKLNNDTLFKLPERNELSLFTELKLVDFLLRSTDEDILKSIKYQLLEEPMISMVYSIPVEKIRNQLNLIFH